MLKFLVMDIITLLDSIDAFLWGPPMIIVLLGTHLYLTVRTRGIQRKIGKAIKMSLAKDEGAEGDVSNFGALVTALAGTIGTGSIVGVATAIISGGPGAVFWMWLTGVFGIATKYTEVYASIKYRVKDHRGEMIGGAMYAWKRAFNKEDGKTPWWATLGAVCFAFFAAIATLGTGSAVQSSAMTEIICHNFPDLPTWIVGVVIALCVALVIFGGVKSIAKICEFLVPIMAVLYTVGCLIILVCNASFLGETISLILECAFTAKAAFGGALGSGMIVALQYGCARGLFSNESGLGTAPIVAAAAASKNPARQSLIASTGTFWSTVVICLMTGLVLVSTMLAHPEIATAGNLEQGAQLANIAFATIPYVGTPILILGMISFAYSTILGWSYYGGRCVTFLFGKHAVLPYQIIYVLVGILGAVGVGDVVWTVCDIGNALMAIPNIILILLLSGKIAKETKYFIYDGHLDEEVTCEIPVYEDK